MGFKPILAALIMVGVGGLGSLTGAVAGGFILNAIEVALQTLLPPNVIVSRCYYLHDRNYHFVYVRKWDVWKTRPGKGVVLCRLFAWHSAEPLSAAEALGSDLECFIDLSQIHRDGWGLAYAGSEGIELVRDVSPAYTSSSFSKLVADGQSTNAIAHLRWATEELSVCIPNTHPFIKQGPLGEIAFCHNGGVRSDYSLTALIDTDLQAEFEGETDSEQYFAALITQLRKCDGDFVSAYRALVKDLAAIHYTSINSLILSATELVIVCKHKPENRSPDLEPNYYDLFWKSNDGVTSAWSSGVRRDSNNFHKLKNGSLLYINIATGEVTTHQIG